MHGRGACVVGALMVGACMAGGGMCVRGTCVAEGGVHGMHVPPADTTKCGHTVNERAVRILLQYILVYLFYFFACILMS